MAGRQGEARGRTGALTATRLAVAPLDRSGIAGPPSTGSRSLPSGACRVSLGGIALRGFVVGTIVTAIAFFVLAVVLPEYTNLDFVTYSGDAVGILVISVVFGLVNGLIGTVIRILALPIRMMTLGLVGFVINGAMLLLTAVILSGTSAYEFTVGDYPPDLFHVNTIVSAIIGAIILSLVSSVVRLVIKD
jgi:putative membrane protein